MINWFKRRKPEVEIITNDIPVSTVWRWYLYDTSLTPDINELAEIIGLSPISEEGEDKEEEDSERRMIAAAPLFPFLENMAELSANVMAALHAKEIVEHMPEATELEDEETSEMIANMHLVYKAIALSTLIGTFSSALELGIIETSTVNSRTYLKERDDNE